MRRAGPHLALLLAACPGTPVPSPSPRPSPIRQPDWSPVTRYLDSAVSAGAAPGAVLAVSTARRRFYHGTGRLGVADLRRPGPRTVYDLASLTKVVSLTSLLMFAVEEGRIELDAPVARYLPAFAGPGKDRITVRLLLAHAAGLPDWRPLYREAGDRAGVFALADSTPLEAPVGTRERYSDIGVILLTQVLEAVYGERIDSLAARRVFVPLGMRATRYLPPAAWRARIAPTERDPWRGRVLRGEVHDENAARMDGVSGHAGLFSNAPDLLTFGEWVLQGFRACRGSARLASARSASARSASTRHGAGAAGTARGLAFPPAGCEFLRPAELVSGSSRALGWDTPSPGGSAGTLLSSESVGHTGFTGTSIWIDPQRSLVLVLLSNRVHPTRDNPRWASVRARVADLVTTILTEAPR